jgi:hypothetical protein
MSADEAADLLNAVENLLGGAHEKVRAAPRVDSLSTRLVASPSLERPHGV